jgi:thiamine biosynthesis lipoprotein
VIGRSLLFFVIFLNCSLVLAYEKLDVSKHYLGTTVNVVVCYPQGKERQAASAMDAVWQKFADAQVHMNAFDPLSDVSLLNKAQGRAVVVDDDVYALLASSKEFKAITGGVFDITVGPLIGLWKDAARKNVFPLMQDILYHKTLVDAGKVELLGGCQVRLPAGMQIDLGGDAAGFLADAGAKIFREAGFRDFLIDAGGEVYAGGVSCQGRPWRVGINDPETRDRLDELVQLHDAAVSTSGSYEKYFTIQGERWSHIINPVTGYPQRGIVSATVIAPTALEADVLSTSLCILGVREGFRLIDRLGSGYAAMILSPENDGRLKEYMSRDYIKFKVDK